MRWAATTAASTSLPSCVDDDAPDPAILYTIPAAARVQLSRPSVYLVIDGQRLDDVLSGRHETKSLAALDDSVRERVASLIKAEPFKLLSFEHLCRCAEAMQPQDVDAGEDVIVQGDKGDFFYVIESGTAEVLRADAGRQGDDALPRSAQAPASARRPCSRASRATPRCA